MVQLKKIRNKMILKVNFQMKKYEVDKNCCKTYIYRLTTKNVQFKKLKK